MITPEFSCTQTDESLIIRIYVPAVRASDISMHVEDAFFSLHINPYFLRLALPGPVVEDDNSSSEYDPATGNLTVTLSKQNRGEEFKDLDLLAKLLAPPKRDDGSVRPVIEVLESKADRPTASEEHELTEAARNDWYLPQTPSESISLPKARYGFLNAYNGYFCHVQMTENEVNELGAEAEKLSLSERRAKREAHEDGKWDKEYYLADFVDAGTITELLSYHFPVESPLSSEVSAALESNEEEEMEMLRLPRKEYLSSKQETHDLYLTLVTILLSYAYDARTTQGDPTPESPWTICSLTAAFSALDPPPYGLQRANTDANSFEDKELQEVILPFVRRSLAFPLYRSFALAEQCVRDVSNCFRRGKGFVLRALMQTKKILDGHEVYDVYNRIWIDDFCCWISTDASDETLKTIGNILVKTALDKKSIGWDLETLEASAFKQVTERAGPDSDDEDVAEPMQSEDDSDDGNSVEFSSLPSSPLSSTSTLSSSLTRSSSGSSSALNFESPE